ncbi:tRNA (34-2'-O)-methyltransferase regulator WDR6 isoform X2 [Anabrus simplex]|uniref:tRNA (34-2'-O)-methyltransferase regulator WDR6 isoform X2 n=1 Tax=Anabrus simplex TaxID=316456 RepID=UPI0035A2D413
MKFYTSVMRTDVTCVVYFEGHVIAGMGGTLYIYEVSSAELKKKISIFHGQKVHGICPGSDKHIAVFGGRLLKIFALDLSQRVQFTLLSSWSIDDWILCLHWLKGGINLALVTANNVILLWNWKTRERVNMAYCEEKCILYSALLAGETWEHLTVLGGTVFREVIVWTPVPQEMGDSPVLYRLRGHQGVIFSISHNPCIGRIYTTSDDRTVGVWKVEPKGPVLWADAEIVLERKVFGHSARVWRCVGLDDIFISIGEDSHLCIWDNNGSLLTRWATHQGGSVWSIDCNQEADLMVTGGGDGGISLWPLKKWKDAALRPAPLSFQGKEYIPRRVAVMASGNIVTTTDVGCLLYCLVQSSGVGTWSEVFHDARLVNYCLLELSRCRHYIALATLNGHILIFQEKVSCEPALCVTVDMAAVDGKIFSIHWLSTKLLLTCGELGKLELWAVQEEKGGSCNLERTHQFLLPPCKERWLTSALLIDTCFLCGDRAGSIHVYSLSTGSTFEKEMDPNDTLLKLHGRLGVSSLECYGNWIFSTGRDGTLRQHRLVRDVQKLEPLCSYRLPMEWVASVSDSPLGLLVAGFVEMNFVIWSQKEQRILVKVPCGGGHRSWDCMIGEHGFNFVHIKNKEIHVLICQFEVLVRPVLQTGFHIRTVNCVRLLKQPRHCNPLFVSAGEDTTIRITSAIHNSDLRGLSIQRSHICSVRALAICSLSESLVLMFSAGGRAQMKAWQLHISESESEEVICQEVTTHMLNPSHYGERKPWRLMEPLMDSQTRYMSLHAVQTSLDTVIVIAGCSDGVLRLFSFNLDLQELQLVGSYEFHFCCILLVSYIEYAHVALSMGTDGNMAFWNMDLMYNQKALNEEKLQPFFVCQLHKSGINSHDSVQIGQNTVLMATGGDDNAIVLTLFQVIVVVPKKKVEMLLQWRKDTAHATQVTGYCQKMD